MSELSAAAYVQEKRLCIIGIYDSAWGPIPFSHGCACETEDGPIDVGMDQPIVVTQAIDESQKVIMANIEREKMRLAAEELVDRTRAGDQNAAATMILVRQNAQKGKGRAIASLKMMLKYAQSKDSTIHGEASTHPAKPNAKVIRVLDQELNTGTCPLRYRSAIMTMLPSLSMLEGSVTLSNGPSLDKDRIAVVIEKMEPEEQKHFVTGFKNWRNTSIKTDDANYRLGRIFGLARSIQLVRLPTTPIAILSKAAGLELD
jgi:hypothetical protein